LPFVSPVLRSTSTTPPHRPSSGIPFHHTKFNNTAPPHQNQRLHSIVTKLNDTVHHKVQQHHFIVTRFNDSVTSSSSTTSSHRHQVQRLHHTVTKFNDSITLSPHSKIPPHRHQVQTHRLIATKFNGTKLKDILIVTVLTFIRLFSSADPRFEDEGPLLLGIGGGQARCTHTVRTGT
jgi:hypothetical protein